MERDGSGIVPVVQTAIEPASAMKVAEVVGNVKRIREVMKAVMEPGIHYAKIPGTPKPSLHKPGAEVLCQAFGLYPQVTIDGEITTEDYVWRRVSVALLTADGQLRGQSFGECSTREEKYAWQKPVCEEEWNETDADRRREVWKIHGNVPVKVKQVRTNPPDLIETVLGMATKRAFVAATRTATACSDVFSQSMEGIAEELKTVVLDEEDLPPAPPAAQGPQATTEPPPPGSPAREAPEGPPPDAAGTAVEPTPTTIAKVLTRTRSERKNSQTGKMEPCAPWTLYTIELGDGRTVTTFDTEIGAIAQEHLAKKEPCFVLTEPQGKFINVVEIVPVPPSMRK